MTSRREQVLQHCHELPAAELSHPFGEDTAVFKIGGRMFALVDLTGRHGRLTLKADPDHAAALVAQHEQVTPGHHMDQRHWITVDLNNSSPAGLPAAVVDDLVEESHALVVAGLPARRRPAPAGPAAQAPPPGPS